MQLHLVLYLSFNAFLILEDFHFRYTQLHFSMTNNYMYCICISKFR